VNRYSLGLRYNLSDYNNLYLRGGDFTPIHNPLTFYNKRVRGVQAGLQLGFFLFDFVYGQTYRGINGAIRQDTSATTTLDGDPLFHYKPGGTAKMYVAAPDSVLVRMLPGI
jgi:hypothetical protein